MKSIKSHEFTYHGIMISDYFQGAGTAFTRFTDVFTGCGSNSQEAAEDALESAAQCGYDVENIVNPYTEEDGVVEYPEEDMDEICDDFYDVHSYITLHVEEKTQEMIDEEKAFRKANDCELDEDGFGQDCENENCRNCWGDEE